MRPKLLISIAWISQITAQPSVRPKKANISLHLLDDQDQVDAIGEAGRISGGLIGDRSRAVLGNDAWPGWC